jgi:hypothetical protein
MADDRTLAHRMWLDDTHLRRRAVAFLDRLPTEQSLFSVAIEPVPGRHSRHHLDLGNNMHAGSVCSDCLLQECIFQSRLPRFFYRPSGAREPVAACRRRLRCLSSALGALTKGHRVLVESAWWLFADFPRMPSCSFTSPQPSCGDICTIRKRNDHIPVASQLEPTSPRCLMPLCHD